jgi:hypothetical protein
VCCAIPSVKKLLSERSEESLRVSIKRLISQQTRRLIISRRDHHRQPVCCAIPSVKKHLHSEPSEESLRESTKRLISAF